MSSLWGQLPVSRVPGALRPWIQICPIRSLSNFLGASSEPVTSNCDYSPLFLSAEGWSLESRPNVTKVLVLLAAKLYSWAALSALAPR